MNGSTNRRATFSRQVISLLQLAAIVGMSGCGVPHVNEGPSTTCVQNTDCLSGFCSDGVCCDSACDQTCMVCNLPDKVGTCSPVPMFAEDLVAPITCSSPAQCDGQGQCLAGLGQTCASGDICRSGFCVDGYCCDSACDQTCMTCGLAGSEGTCGPVPALAEDDAASFPCIAPYRTCNGDGVCLTDIGQSCTDPVHCISGFCADGVCCESACTDACKSCGLSGSYGTCLNLPANEIDPYADNPCIGPGFSCNGVGECQPKFVDPCPINGQCPSGLCSNGLCQPAIPQPGPFQWQWSNDQTVCKDPNGVGFVNQYPTVDVRQIVARTDESIYGVGNYTLPSQGLASAYGTSQWGPGMYHINDVVKEGPHTFQLDIAPSGGSASWSTIAQYEMTECFTNQCYTICSSLTCLGGTAGFGPFIEPAGGDVLYFYEKLGVQRWASATTTKTCQEGELSKRALPQWTMGTNEVCAHEEIVFAGDVAGNVVVREDDRLKKYDSAGTLVLDIPTPFDFAPTALGLSATGDIYAALRSSAEVRLARTGPTGILDWTKKFVSWIPAELAPSMNLVVDASGNSILAFYARNAISLGNGPMQPIGATDIVLAKFDGLGGLSWAKRMGSGNFVSSLFSMRKVGADDIALAVHFTGSVDLGDGMLQSSPVLIKYDTSGNLVWRADLLSLYPQPAPEVRSLAISGHPSGAIFVAGTGYGLASSTPEPYCDLGVSPDGVLYLSGTYPRPLRVFAAKYGP